MKESGPDFNYEYFGNDLSLYSFDLALLYKAFGDLTRIKILCLLLKNEACVQDISAELNFSQSAVSHQLSILKNARLVKFRKEGRQVYYSLDDYHVEGILRQGLEHLAHNAVELKNVSRGEVNRNGSS